MKSINELTQEEILQYNRMCAAFLGYDLSKIVDVMPVNKDGDYCNGNGDLDADGNPCYLIYAPSVFKFHWDWNWIMKVIEKIGSLPFAETQGLREYIDDNFNDWQVHIFSKKDVVVQTINNFLLWYNKNKR